MALKDVPSVPFANVGGSGSWGYRFPDGVFGSDSSLAVRKMDGPLVFETPFGDSPPFGQYELTNALTGERRQFFRVWMHGQNPAHNPATLDDPFAGTSMRSSEKVFWVLEQAKTKWILIDASVGGINPLLDSWDLVIAHDFFDDMKRVPRLFRRGLLNLRNPFCPHLRNILFESAGERLPHYTALAQRIEGKPIYPKIVRRGISITPDGPWLESSAQVADYQRRGFDIVGKTLVPEVQLARAIGAHFACLNPVVNPAEGLSDPDSGARIDWQSGDLFRIYDNYGPLISSMILGAIARIDVANPGCPCEQLAAGGVSPNYARFIE